MPVVGMGGYFFRARDPEALKAWYREHLGVGGGVGTDAKGESNAYLWYQEAGPTVFEPFKESSDYFPADRTAMINLRVRDLKDLLDRLRAAGIEISQEMSDPGMGSFARVHDPEGNPIELWEPPAD
ncbi:MAG TPA: VOC family protein [Allosphingosinicella sp.]|jgi:predicted enzyme related to lactoylglutathione lyase